MKNLIALFIMSLSFVSFAEPVTGEKMVVDKEQQTLCGISLGMSQEQVKRLLTARNIDFVYGQRFDPNTQTLVENKSVLMMYAREYRFVFSVNFKEDKVWLMEVYFSEAYPESTAQRFADRLWTAAEGTQIEVIGSTLQISRK